MNMLEHRKYTTPNLNDAEQTNKIYIEINSIGNLLVFKPSLINAHSRKSVIFQKHRSVNLTKRAKR